MLKTVCFINAVYVALISISTSNSLIIEEEPLDVIFIVDGSARAEEELFREELLLIPQIIAQLSYKRNKIRFGLITYSDQPTLQIGLGYVQDKKALLEKLWHIKHEHSRRKRLCFALRFVRTYIFNEETNRKRFVIMFPNGMWNLPDTTNSEVKQLRGIGVKVLMVAIGNSVKRETIIGAMDPTSIIYKPHISLNFIQKKYIINFIINNIYPKEKPAQTSVSSIMITTPTTSTHFNITTKTTIRPTYHNKITTLTTEFSIPQVVTNGPQVRLPDDCNPFEDIVFLIDASSGVSATNFKKMISAIEKLAIVLQKAKTKIHLAIVTFGKTPILNLSFEDYRKTTDIGKFIRNIKQQGGVNGLGRALSFIHRKVIQRSESIIIITFIGSEVTVGPDPNILYDYSRLNFGVLPIFVRIGNIISIMKRSRRFQEDIDVRNFDGLLQSHDRIVKIICS